MKITIISFAFAMASACHAQDINAILRSIEQNNPSLKALRAGNEAMMLENMTGLTLDDPEVSYSYMFGSPSDVPNKTNIEVIQSFDFATISGAKKNVAKGQNKVLEAQYKQEAQKILQEAHVTIINLAYGNQLLNIYDECCSLYKEAMTKMQKAYEKGEITIMSLNNMKMRLNALDNDMRMAKIDRNTALSQLTVLNGGAFNYTVSEFPKYELPLSFDTWLEEAQRRNPELLALDAQIDLSQKNVNLARKEGLPSFSVGYVNELVKGENYHGFQVGLSLPLWGNRGKVKAAKASAEAMQMTLDAEKMKFAIELRALYDRTAALGVLVNQYKEVIETADNTQLLNKALEAGNISISDYVTEIDTFNETKSKYLEALRDYHLSLSELLKYSVTE